MNDDPNFHDKNKCKCVHCLYEQIVSFNKRIDQLVDVHVIYTMRQTIETWQKGCEILINNLQSKIKELEKDFESKLDFNEVHPKKYPYKCPVCLGESKIQVMHGLMEPFEKRIIDSAGRHFKLCHTCEGTGIVWS